ncbi:hypothetical protein ANRL4_01500 [Anaerolineae bacterium]|nr:hypothetical protein ANRL4_01500 [Anaerolineae bacterium]
MTIDYFSTASEFLSSYKLNGQAVPLKEKKAIWGWREGLETGKPGVQPNPHWPEATGWAYAPHKGSTDVILDVDDPDHPLPAYLVWFFRLNFTLVVGRDTHRHYYFRLAYPMQSAIISIREEDVMVIPGDEPDDLVYGSFDNKEIVSLRGYGGYAASVGSQHPSGDTYRIIRPYPLRTLTASETDELLRLLHQFKPQGGIPSPTAPQRSPKPNEPRSAAGPGSEASPKMHFTGKNINPRLIAAVVQALEVWEGRDLKLKRSGQYSTASLFRNLTRSDDRNRSSYFVLETCTVFDRATGEMWGTAQLCNFFGIRMNDFGGLYAPNC